MLFQMFMHKKEWKYLAKGQKALSLEHNQVFSFQVEKGESFMRNIFGVKKQIKMQPCFRNIWQYLVDRVLHLSLTTQL